MGRYVAPLFAALLAGVATAPAADVSILRVAILLDADDKLPLEGATVELTYDNFTIDSKTTGPDGLAEFRDLEIGRRYTLIFSKPGHTRLELDHVAETVEQELVVSMRIPRDVGLVFAEPEFEQITGPATVTPPNDRKLPKRLRRLTDANASDYVWYVARFGRYREKQIADASLYLEARTGIPASGVVNTGGKKNWLVFQGRLQEDAIRWSAKMGREADDHARHNKNNGFGDSLQHRTLLGEHTELDEAGYAKKYVECMDARHDMIYCHSMHNLGS